MSRLFIDGKALAKRVRASLKEEVASITPALGRAPTLAVVLVGSDPASQVYVSSKSKMAARCGIDTVDIRLTADASQVVLEERLAELSQREDVDGILLQLPLPEGFDEFSALSRISPEKDVDGLHPTNQGLLMRGAKAHRPCTPLGCVALIDRAREQLGLPKDISGLHAVVLGRSVLVGKPIALLLLERNCTVTMCHSRTQNIEAICASADILVAAIGKPHFVPSSWVKEGALVIDVGINRLEDGSLVGDVSTEEAASVASAITPVPGGVGPMTIAMLLQNTVSAARQRLG